MKFRPINIAGQRFGMLVAIEFVSSDRQGSRWQFLCDCGVFKVISYTSVKRGSSTSCGCVRYKFHARGISNRRLYTIWLGMRARCLNPNHTSFQRYGGRGIVICKEWECDFAAFYYWAVHHGYSSGLTIERIDNDNNYGPSNCRWATRAEQDRNRRNSLLVDYEGKSQILKDWSTELGIPYPTLQSRHKKGLTPDTGLFALSHSLASKLGGAA